MYRVHLGLGSNIAPRHEHLASAVEKIGRIARVTSVSSVYETEPVAMEGAEDFLNMAMEIETEDDPPLLLAKLRAIEKGLGRKPSSHRAPRTIDIDILLYRGMAYSDLLVTVPHPELHRRRFALEPLSEIAPAALHPTLERTVSWLLRNCRDPHRVSLAGSLPETENVRTA
jgi:2-amino-4-hydroxy-6-hydroxymethyldihydropteridine diphosphokinase